MMVAQRRLFDGVERPRGRSLDVLDARRRPQVVDDGIRAAEAGGGDDLFVVDALAAVAGFLRVRGVALVGDGAELAVGGHGGTFSCRANRRAVFSSTLRYSLPHGV